LFCPNSEAPNVRIGQQQQQEQQEPQQSPSPPPQQVQPQQETIENSTVEPSSVTIETSAINEDNDDEDLALLSRLRSTRRSVIGESVDQHSETVEKSSITTTQSATTENSTVIATPSHALHTSEQSESTGEQIKPDTVVEQTSETINTKPSIENGSSTVFIQEKGTQLEPLDDEEADFRNRLRRIKQVADQETTVAKSDSMESRAVVDESKADGVNQANESSHGDTLLPIANTVAVKDTKPDDGDSSSTATDVDRPSTPISITTTERHASDSPSSTIAIASTPAALDSPPASSTPIKSAVDPLRTPPTTKHATNSQLWSTPLERTADEDQPKSGSRTSLSPVRKLELTPEKSRNIDTHGDYDSVRRPLMSLAGLNEEMEQLEPSEAQPQQLNFDNPKQRRRVFLGGEAIESDGDGNGRSSTNEDEGDEDDDNISSFDLSSEHSGTELEMNNDNKSELEDDDQVSFFCSFFERLVVVFFYCFLSFSQSVNDEELEFLTERGITDYTPLPDNWRKFTDGKGN
jgi:hypothetical protein